MPGEQQAPLFTGTETAASEISRWTPLASAIRIFCVHLRRDGKSAYTVTGYGNDLQLLASRFGDNARVGKIQPRHLTRFLVWMETRRGVPCSRKTYARRVTALKSFFSWLREIGAIDSDPSANLQQRSGPAPLSDVLTDAQARECERVVDELLADGDDFLRVALCYHLLASTGMKLGELLALPVSNVEILRADSISILIEGSRRYLHKKRRLTIENQKIRRILADYVAGARPGPLLINDPRRRIQTEVEMIGREASLPFKLTPEILRWTKAISLVKAGIASDHIRETLGIGDRHWGEVRDKIEQLMRAHPQLISE